MELRGYSENTDPRPNHSNMDQARSTERSNMPQNDLPRSEDDKDDKHQHHHRRHHKRHYHRMRMHDHNVRTLIDIDLEISQACICDDLTNPSTSLEVFGAWGTNSQSSKTNQPKAKKPNHKRNSFVGGRFYTGSASSKNSSLSREREAVNEEDAYRFQHYEDISFYIKQYREENTICIQGEDPCGPPVLGKDTPDPYFAKLSQCGDLWDRLMAYTALAREQMYDSDPSRDAFLRVLHPRDSHSASSLPLSADLQMRGHATRKAINLAPVRDCRVAVKTINFPHAAPPKRQPNHIPQLQAAIHSSQTPNLPDIQSTRITLPLPVRLLVNSNAIKENKLTSLSPPQTPPKPEPSLVRSESVDRQLHAHYRLGRQALAKKRSEGDIRYPICSTATATDFSLTDPNIYQQFLAQQRKLNRQNISDNSSKNNSKKELGKPQPLDIYKRYSSTSLVPAVNKGY